LCKQAVDRLALNDASVVVRKENSEALGPGFRAGFLGMLHMEVFMQVRCSRLITPPCAMHHPPCAHHRRHRGLALGGHGATA
jgi:hypothetical protein